jgi:hypothetical protein
VKVSHLKNLKENGKMSIMGNHCGHSLELMAKELTQASYRYEEPEIFEDIREVSILFTYLLTEPSPS